VRAAAGLSDTAAVRQGAIQKVIDFEGTLPKLRGMSWTILITARTWPEVGRPAEELFEKAGCRILIPEEWGALPKEKLLKHLKEADAVLASPDDYSKEVLASSEARRLKIISRWGVGFDSIDIGEATRQGVVVAFTPGLLDETVADYAFALLLAVTRQIHTGHSSMSRREWSLIWGNDVYGKTLGIIGCGRIGRAVARRAAGFNLRLLGYDVHPTPEAESLGIRFIGLEELLQESDFVSLHAALTPQNRGMIGEKQLRQMKPGAYLVNTARGALVDETALARVLHEGGLAGAALDAFASEPLPLDHPLYKAPNVLLTPHLASFARETGERVSLTAAQAIVNWMEGKRPQFVVNPEVFESDNLRRS
jgi:phosphoglycerate dehydrogenase-like enzyme